MLQTIGNTEPLFVVIISTIVICVLAAVIPRIKSKKLIVIMLILYVLLVIVITLSRESNQNFGVTAAPFNYIYRVYTYYQAYGLPRALEPLFGAYLNVLLFVPFGLLILWFKKWRVKRIVILALMISLVIETTQLILNLGIFEIDDIINNTLGAWAGCWIYKKALRRSEV